MTAILVSLLWVIYVYAGCKAYVDDLDDVFDMENLNITIFKYLML